jgi:hypothetical protein
MVNKLPHSDVDRLCGTQLRDALVRIEQIVREGLKHGHFRFSVSGSIVNGKRRELLIEAGLSHKFTIPEDELPR